MAQFDGRDGHRHQLSLSRRSGSIADSNSSSVLNDALQWSPTAPCQTRRIHASLGKPDNHSSASYGRRCTSESQATPIGNDASNDILANIAAIQLLNGCISLPRHRILSKSCHSVDLFTCESEGLPRLTLHMVPTVSVQVHRSGIGADLGRQCSMFLVEDPPALETGVDGHICMSSGDSNRRDKEVESATESSGSLGDEQLPSIENILHQHGSKRERRRRKLYTSEVSRTEDSPNIDNDRMKSDVKAGKLGDHHGTANEPMDRWSPHDLPPAVRLFSLPLCI